MPKIGIGEIVLRAGSVLSGPGATVPAAGSALPVFPAVDAGLSCLLY
jgi:hypothetical protein